MPVKKCKNKMCGRILTALERGGQFCDKCKDKAKKSKNCMQCGRAIIRARNQGEGICSRCKRSLFRDR